MRASSIYFAVCCLLLASFPLSGQVFVDPDLQAEQVVGCPSNCIPDFPTSMAFIGDDDFLLTTKNTGLVLRVTNDGVQLSPVLDVPVFGFSESGLLGIATDPDFINNQYVYLFYMESSTGEDTSDSSEALGNRLYRYTWDGSALVDPLLLLDLPVGPVVSGHNGGVLRFGPDDRLYLIFGDKYRDGKLQNFPEGPDPDDTGVIFRINTLGHGQTDNPFYDSDDPTNPLNRYYAYGIRNGFGLAFDPLTGDLWDTENGLDDYDEVNRIEPGFNSGWEQIMGPDALDPQGEEDLWSIPGSVYSDPEFSWKDTLSPAAIGFVGSRKLGCDLEHDVLVSGSNCATLMRFELDPTRSSFVFSSPELQDLVADNDGDECELEQTEIMFGTGFTAATDIVNGPDGSLYVVTFGDRRVYRISLAPDSVPDADGDGVDDGCDCNPGDGTAFMEPLEVPRIRLSGSLTTSFGWDAQAGIAGDGTTYTVIRGELSHLRTTGDFNLACTYAAGLALAKTVDSQALPGSGTGYYYLVRASNACADGTYGDGSGIPNPRALLDLSTPAACQ